MEIELGYQESATDVLTDVAEQKKWNELVDKLGLIGQRSITTDDDPLPFRAMTTHELRVYETLFATEVSLQDFGVEMIPLRVLDTIAVAKKHFKLSDMKVRHDLAKINEDPIVYAVTQDPINTWIKTYYFIARWGTTLLDFPTLAQMAADKKRGEWQRRANDSRRLAENLERDMEQNLEAFADSGAEPSLYP